MTKSTASRISALRRAISLLCVLVLLSGFLPARGVLAAEAQYGRINHDEVRLRRQANSTEVWAMLDTGWVCEIRGEKRSGGTDYYYVVTNIPKHLDREYYGYVSQEFMTVMTAEEVTAWENAGGNGALSQGGTVTATDAPSAGTGDQNPSGGSTDVVTVTSYAQPNNSSTNYYSYNGSALSSLGLLSASEAYYVAGTATIGDTAYYIILVNGVNCYVKASNMTMLTTGGQTPAPTDAPPASSGTVDVNGAIGRIRITPAGKTNLRSSAAMISGNVVAKIEQGRELPFFSTLQSGSKTWYYCYDASANVNGYILGTCAVVVESYATTPPTSGSTGATPAPGASSGSVVGYVKITPSGKTNIRSRTQVNANNVVAKAEQGDVLPYYATSVVNGMTWYYVYVAKEAVFGYVLGSCCTKTDAGGNVPQVTQTPDGTTILGYILFTAGGVNLRKTPSLGAKVLGRFDKGDVTPYYNIETRNGVNWYFVRQDGDEGYVHGSYCQPCDFAGNIITNPTDQPGGVTQGYLMTTADKVYVRKNASTGAGVYGQVKTKGTVLPIIGATIRNGSTDWYCVAFEDNIGYIHGKYISVLTKDQVDAYLSGNPMPTAGPTPTPAPKPTNYITTTADKVWIRKSPSTKAGTQGQANLGAVFQFTGTTTVGSTLWYKVTVNGETCYMMGKYCRVMTDAEYNNYVGSLPTARITPTPKPEDWSTTALTNTTKVIVRAGGSAGAKQLALLYKANQVCTLLGGTNVSGGYTWYNVRVNGTNGWIRGDLLRILTKEQAAIFEKTGDPEARPEASYNTLQLGSTGEAVTKLQNRLIDLGYLPAGSANGTYGSTTAEAIKKYQTDYNLTVDGIAGSLTQHSLYGTVETGYYENQGGSSTSVTLYKPELIDWYTGGIQSIFYRGCVATVTDVKTGISFKVKRWAGGDHADVEPLTAADTAAMCKIYGVSTAQQISDKNLWQRRSLLVTINGHSYCASMYGIPHNYPAGDTIPDNDFNGQFCIHFVNSKTHASDKVDKDHQDAIMYAYNNAARLLNIK